MKYSRINAYRNMWIFVFFDLPVQTDKQRKNATKFRNSLLEFGFNMMQFSVYTRFVTSKQKANVYLRKINRIVPEDGFVSIFMITDKQYSQSINYWGKSEVKPNPIPGLFEIF